MTTITTNTTIGRLTAVRKTGDTTQKGTPIWRCLCECGEYIDLSESELSHRQRTDCGCDRTNAMIIESAVLVIHNQLKARAKRKDINFRLAPNETKALLGRPCENCKTAPSTLKLIGDFTFIGRFSHVHYNDPDVGYTIGNCRSLCERCSKKAVASLPRKRKTTQAAVKEDAPTKYIAPVIEASPDAIAVPEGYDDGY